MSTNTSGETDLVIESYEARTQLNDVANQWFIWNISKDWSHATLSNLRAGELYDVGIRVKYSGARYSTWEWRRPPNFYLRPNRAPRLTAGSLNPTYILELGGNDSVQRIDNKFTDADNDTLTYTASSTPAGIVTATIEDGEIENGITPKNLRIHLLNPITGAVTVTYGAHDAYGGYAFQNISVGGLANMTREVAENSAVGTAVGDPVAGTPHGTETLTYSLTGEAATSGLFEIDSSTGQVSVAEGATLDYEAAKNSYTGKVKWTVQGQDAEVNLTINVTDENEPPLAPVNVQVTNITDTSFTITWEAPDNTGRPAITGYELKGDNGLAGRSPSATTFSESYTSLSPGTTYTFDIKAQNADGDGAEVLFTATTTNTRPRSADFTKYFRDGENAAFAQSDFPFSSDESDDVLANVKFTSIPTSEGAFKLKQSDGTLNDVAVNSLIAASDIGNLVFVPVTNFDGTATTQFKVIDQESEESGSAYTLTLREVANFPPTFAAGPLSREVPENSASGTAVGAAVTATDPDSGDTLTYSLSGTDASSFTIDSGTGQISVASGTALDYEAAKNTYEVEVGVSDSKDDDGNADTVVDAAVTVNIAVANVNEGAPPSVTFSLSKVAATRMKVTVTPPDTTSTSPIKQYTVAWKAGSDFNILASPAESDGSVTLDSGTTETTLTGLTPSTTYYVKVVAVNLDEQTGAEPTAQTATTTVNTAPDSADFTKRVSRINGTTFSASDFPFTDPEPGDVLSKVKIVTLPGHTDIYGKTTGELRLDGTAATAGQEVSAADLGKLKYVPQPDGFRVDIGGSFTFKVLDGDGEESPAYTVTLEQIPDIVLSLSANSFAESVTPSSGGRVPVSVTVTATLNGPVRSSATTIPQINVHIDYDARENSDYTVNTNEQALTIPAGQKSASVTFVFNGIPDSLVEGDELIKIYPDWVINGISTTPTEWVEAAYLTLEDNDFAWISLTSPNGEIEEGEDAVFTVKLSGRVIADPATVAWSASTGTASEDDFALSSGTVTFPGGSNANATQTITIPVADDLLPETKEEFWVTLGAITSKAGPNVSLSDFQERRRAYIAESDAVTVSVSGDERVSEGDSATYTISLDSALSTDAIRVSYDTVDYTAKAGSDYTLTHGTASIPAGQTSTTVTVATTENTADEANRYFRFRVAGPWGGGGPDPVLSTTRFVNTTIVDDDGDPSSVVLSVDKTSFGEADAGQMVNVTATLEGGTLAYDTTVVVTLGGSATEGSSGDYTATTLGNITITGGESSGTANFTVTPVNDAVVEGDETILLQGASAGLDVTPATITITDDDTATLGIAADAELVVEGSNAEFTVTLSHEVASQVVVAWSAGSTASVAASDDDYAPDSGSVIFPADSAAGATKTITMSIIDDGTDEQRETFTVTLGSVTGNLASRVSVDTAKSSADATISNEQVVTVTLSGPRSFPHVRNTDLAVYHVFLSGPVNADVMVDVTTSDGTATGCDASSNSCTGGQTGDYGRVSETLTIGPSKDTQHNANDSGVTWYPVWVYMTGHPRSGPDETFTVSISNLRGGGTTPVVLGNSSVTTTITSTPLTFSVEGPEFVDEGTNARFVVKRNVDLHPALGARVDYATSGGTAIEGGDYLGVSGTLEMPIITTSAPATEDEYQQRYSDWEVLVPIVADNADESDETFSLTLSNPETYYAGYNGITAAALGTATATATIRDRAMTVSVSGPETVVEGGYADFTVSLSRTPSTYLTVNYQTYNALATMVRATSGEDFTAQAGTLTFVAGETSKRVRVPILTDSTREVVEYFRLLLSSPRGGGGLTPTLGTSAVTTGIVDAAGLLYGATLTVTPSSMGEGDTATSITLKADLDCCVTFDDPVAVLTALDGTATLLDDYTATFANVPIPATKATGSATMSITPVEDDIVEGGETIVVHGLAEVDLNGTLTGLLIRPATIDVTDNDTATVGITGPTAEVAEGSNAEFTVTLSKAIAKETTVAWSAPLATDTAVAADLGVTSGTVTFAENSAAGETQTISIPITDDTDPEPAETFTVTLGAVGGDLASLVSVDSAASSASATIAQSDAITVSISGPSSVDEGDATGNYTVSLSPSGVTPTADLTVSYKTADGTATAGTDYTAIAATTLTFTRTAAGPQTFTVQTTEDAIDESGETFTVSISSPSGGGGPTPSLGTAKSVTTTITDDDDAPTGIALSASPSSLGEDDSATSVTITAALNGGTTRTSATLVTIGTLSGTATKDTDYAATSLASITIPANSTRGTGSFTITPTDDLAVEGDETIIVSGTTTVGLDVSDAIITLTDDDKSTTTPTDDKDSAELSISGPSANVSEGNNAVFTVTLSQAVDAEVQVAWSAPLAADAAESADLSATSGTVTFAANSAAGATQSITITATDDKLSETAESFTVTLGTITSTLSSQVSLKNGANSATATIAQSDPITIELAGPSSVDEGDATSNYTVSLSPSGVKPTADLTVSYATSNGTATAGSDYTAKSGTLTFTSTDHADKTFTVQTTEDAIDESGETFKVSISSPSGGGGPSPSLATAKSVATTITDDDDAPSGIALSASPSSLGEDDSATSVTVTATLNGGTTRTTATVVTIGTLAGTATKDTDYTATTLASITIPANTASGTGTLTITPTDDTVVEGDETITIPGSTTTQVGLSVTPATITLTDDDKSTTTPNDKDKAELSISAPTGNVNEGNNAVFTVTLSKAVAADVTVAWSAPLGTDAAEGADLGATSGTVTFAADSAAGATQSITITATDDKLSETAESFTVTLGTITSTLSPQLSLKSGASSATATIAASDPITVNISGPSSVDEGDATGNYTVSLSPSGVTPTAELTVSYATADGSGDSGATAGSDYTAKSGSLTFSQTAAGSQTFTVQTTEDTIDESGETFTVTISSPSGGGGPSPSLATAKSVTTTITDDDNAPSGITLSASPSSLGEDDSATSVTVTATLSGGTTRTSDTVVTIGTLSGTALKSADYIATSLASITIPANTASGTGTLTITPTDDDVVEGDETIIIPGTTTVAGLSVTSATITLTDDDKSTTTIPGDKDSAELSISGPTGNVSEGNNAVFTVTLSETVAAAVTVAWSAPLGTDSAEGADLSAISGTVTFGAGSAAGATQSITIMATDDVLSETAESFTVTLGTITSTLSSQLSLKNGASSATATIAASDPITVNISGPSSVDEGDATGNYTVSLSPSGVTPTADLTVSYATANGSGDSGATAGSDYTAKSGTLTFTQTAAGSQTFTVQTTEDSIDEGSGETFTVSISGPSGGGGPSPSLATAKSVTTTITDDDDAPSGIALSASPSSLGEDDSATSVTVTATLSGGTTRTSATVVTIGTLAGSATKDTDYAATALASITIPANTASGTGTLTITPTDDLVVEGDETITIPGSTTVGLTVSSATVTLTDDDKSTTGDPNDKDSAELSISAPTGNVNEGNNAVFTVTLSKAVAAEVTVAWSAPLGTDAAEGADLGATSGTVTFAADSAAEATQSITITAADDALSETAESFTVTLGAITTTLPSTQVTLKSGSSSATATIAVSDPITIAISGPSTVDEGDATGNYTVSLSPPGVTPTADLTVSYATADGTATAGTDYTAKSGSLTFTQTAAGSQTFTVQTTEDSIDESGETFTVTISSPSGGGGPSPSLATAKSVTTTITDDDNAPSGIALSASPSSLGEDDSATSVTITAALNGGTTRTSATLVTIGTLSGTATKGTDYTATALASITIPANTASGTGTTTISPADDLVVEGDETIIVSGTTTVGLDVSDAIITLTDDDKSTTTPTDDKDSAELSITGPSANVREGSDATFTVTLSQAVDAEVQVAWSAPLAADAAEGADLSATSGTVTFGANSAAGATQSITITATDDALSETAESFTVTLGTITSSLSSQVSLKSGASSATATISESDPITIDISGPSSVDEGDVATFKVTLTGGTPTEDLTVNYTTSDVTATAGDDYTAESGTLTFTQTAPGAQTVDVQTTDDILDEDTESFSIMLSNAQGGGGPAVTMPVNAVNTGINDNDALSDPPDNQQNVEASVSIQLSVSPSSVDEGDGSTPFTVTATHNGSAQDEDVTIQLALAGTATLGSTGDYTAPGPGQRDHPCQPGQRVGYAYP